MDPSEEVSRSLVKWLQSLAPERARTINEISDGVAILHALLKISPENFNQLGAKIKLDVSNNWRLKVSNLKKVNEAILEFYQDNLSLQVLDAGLPDVVKLGEMNDITQLGKLLRLLLGCAVNCERKQEYITKIMDLEESVQQCIMQAIQQLEELTGGPGRSGLSLLSLDNETRVLKLVSDLDAANESKENLTQMCHNLEEQVRTLQEEKQTLLTDNQLLARQIQEQQVKGSPRGLENRKQIELLKEEIFQLETLRDDYRAKVLDQEKQMVSMQDKISELQLAVEATSRLKDEVDALTETADKVKTLEIAVASYKKKLEDYYDIKKQCITLEDKNVEYLKLNLKYEDELKKQNVWRNQCDVYKTQTSDFQQKIDDLTQQLDKVNFLNKTQEAKLNALHAEQERLVLERDTLREENEELQLGTRKNQDGAAMAQELTPTEMKERLRFLEKENSTLRFNNQNLMAKQVTLDDALSRLEKLSEQNRGANQKIIELEAQIEESKQKDESTSAATIYEHKQKISNLQEALAFKEKELQSIQAKYARNLEKAREVAMSMEGKSNGSIESIRQNMMKEDESRLITSAYYRLSEQCLREAVNDRLSRHSFLATQRQSMPRK